MDGTVRDSYDSAAEAYAQNLGSELDGKPLDRHLLNRFAEELLQRGLVADLGCGPGHIARYLHERGVQMVGIDLSPAMVRIAQGRNAGIPFRTGDMTALDLDDASLAGIVAFYSIVHLDAAALDRVFAEMHRVLVAGGLALVAFHVGEEVIHLDELFGCRVFLDFRFHDPADVVARLERAGLHVIERCDRDPYPEAEHQSHRSYLLARKAYGTMSA